MKYYVKIYKLSKFNFYEFWFFCCKNVLRVYFGSRHNILYFEKSDLGIPNKLNTTSMSSYVKLLKFIFYNELFQIKTEK